MAQTRSRKKTTLKPIDLPAYRYWSALLLSFFSKRVYVDVGKRWHGLGLLYLLLAIAVFSIPVAFRIGMDLNKAFNQQVIEPLEKIPTVYVQNGKVQFDKPMPYIMKNSMGQAVVIIDTTGKVNGLSDEYPYLTVLINEDKITLKLPSPELFGVIQNKVNPGVPIVQHFTPEMNLAFTGSQLVEGNSIKALKYASEAMIYPIVLAILYPIFLVCLIVLGFLGQLFSQIFFSFKISFAQGCRLLIVSATPIILLFMIMLAGNWVFPGFGFLLLIILAFYFSYALFALQEDSKQLVS